MGVVAKMTEDINTEEINQAYERFNGNIAAVSRHFGCSHNAITKRLKEQVFGDPNGGPKDFFKKLKHDRIVEAHRKTGGNNEE